MTRYRYPDAWQKCALREDGLFNGWKLVGPFELLEDAHDYANGIRVFAGVLEVDPVEVVQLRLPGG